MAEIMNALLSGFVQVAHAQSTVVNNQSSGGGTLTNTNTNVALAILVALSIVFAVGLLIYSRRRENKKASK